MIVAIITLGFSVSLLALAVGLIVVHFKEKKPKKYWEIKK